MLTVDTTGIPTEELEKYSHNLRTLHIGGEILVEGQEDDRAIYLLRKGQVGVYRMVAGESRRIAAIDAVNIFGEMALVSGGPRTATIRALTDVLVYKFPVPDIHTVVDNPVWSELLVTRLVQNLKSTSDRLVSTESEMKNLQARDSGLSLHTLILITAISELVDRVAGDVVVNSREWHFLNGLTAMTDQYLRDHLPELYAQTEEYRVMALKRISREPGLTPLIRGMIAEICHQS